LGFSALSISCFEGLRLCRYLTIGAELDFLAELFIQSPMVVACGCRIIEMIGFIGFRIYRV
jgi:hypothetical protein